MCCTKEIISKVKRQPSESEKIIANEATDKQLISKIYKQLPDAVLTAPETRSSSPVRINRDGTSQSVTLRGLYPCGEGAGYAGGIVSAAVDGERCAVAAKEYLS